MSSLVASEVDKLYIKHKNKRVCTSKSQKNNSRPKRTKSQNEEFHLDLASVIYLDRKRKRAVLTKRRKVTTSLHNMLMLINIMGSFLGLFVMCYHYRIYSTVIHFLNFRTEYCFTTLYLLPAQFLMLK